MVTIFTSPSDLQLPVWDFDWPLELYGDLCLRQLFGEIPYRAKAAHPVCFLLLYFLNYFNSFFFYLKYSESFHVSTFLKFSHGRSQDFSAWNTFPKFLKILLRKLRKRHSLSMFFNKFNTPFVNFLRVWTKNTIQWKFSKNVNKVS